MVQKCCLTLGWDSIGWDNISPDVQILGTDLSPVGENIMTKYRYSLACDLNNRAKCLKFARQINVNLSIFIKALFLIDFVLNWSKAKNKTWTSIYDFRDRKVYCKNDCKTTINYFYKCWRIFLWYILRKNTKRVCPARVSAYCFTHEWTKNSFFICLRVYYRVRLPVHTRS